VDAITVAVLATIHEAPIATEILYRHKQFAITDSGLAEESPSDGPNIMSLVTVDDAGIGVDVWRLPGINYFTVTDSGSAVEGHSVVKSMPVVAEQAICTETITPAVLVTIEEAAIAEDIVLSYNPSTVIVRVEIAFSAPSVEIEFYDPALE
jgi:hypothetical protein